MSHDNFYVNKCKNIVKGLTNRQLENIQCHVIIVCLRGTFIVMIQLVPLPYCLLSLDLVFAAL